MADSHAQVMAILARTAPRGAPGTPADSQNAADAVCARCHVLMHWPDARTDAKGAELLCEACATKTTEAAAKSPIAWGAILKHPTTWVAAMVALASLLFLLGVGNPRLSTLAAQDTKRPWHQQALPAAWLGQVERTALRLEIQRTLGAKPAAMAPWQRQRLMALQQLIALWSDTPVAPDLKLAIARMEAALGQREAALKLAVALAPAFADTPERKRMYRYQFAMVQLDSGLAAGGQTMLEDLLREMDDGDTLEFDPMASVSAQLDDMLADHDGNGKGARQMVIRVRRACHTDTGADALEQLVMAAFDAYGLDSELARSKRRKANPFAGNDGQPSFDLLIDRQGTSEGTETDASESLKIERSGKK